MAPGSREAVEDSQAHKLLPNPRRPPSGVGGGLRSGGWGRRMTGEGGESHTALEPATGDGDGFPTASAADQQPDRGALGAELQGPTARGAPASHTLWLASRRSSTGTRV